MIGTVVGGVGKTEILDRVAREGFTYNQVDGVCLRGWRESKIRD